MASFASPADRAAAQGFFAGRDEARHLCDALLAKAGDFSEVVEVGPGRFVHHVPVKGPGDVDPDLQAGLQAAREAVA